MPKSSYDYVELAGLAMTIFYIKSLNDSSLEGVLAWLQARHKELQNK